MQMKTFFKNPHENFRDNLIRSSYWKKVNSLENWGKSVKLKNPFAGWSRYYFSNFADILNRCLYIRTQPAFTSSKVTIETLEQGVKNIQS